MFQALRAEKEPAVVSKGVGEGTVRDLDEKGDTWKNGRVEVRKGSLGRVPSPPTPSLFLRRAAMGRGWRSWGRVRAFLRSSFPEHYCRSSPRNAREEASWVSAALCLGFSRGGGRAASLAFLLSPGIGCTSAL